MWSKLRRVGLRDNLVLPTKNGKKSPWFIFVNIEQLVGGIWGLHDGGVDLSWELPPVWLPSGVLGQLLCRLGWGEVDG